jgi:hypothetical protein
MVSVAQPKRLPKPTRRYRTGTVAEMITFFSLVFVVDIGCIFSKGGTEYHCVPCTAARGVCVVSHYSEPNTATHYTEKLLDSVTSMHHSA